MLSLPHSMAGYGYEAGCACFIHGQMLTLPAPTLLAATVLPLALPAEDVTVLKPAPLRKQEVGTEWALVCSL